MSYRHEFAENWRYLLAATFGMALGLSLHSFVEPLFAPALIAEFEWSHSQFALIGSASLFAIVLVPSAGRFTDHVGPRTAAITGFTLLPLIYLIFSAMTGNFALFFGTTILKLLVGPLTTTMVFARIVVERFDRARGLALSIVMTGAPLGGAIGAPIVAEFIEQIGWRDAYRALALITAVGGLITVLLMGRGPSDLAVKAPRPRFTLAEMGYLVRRRTVLLVLGGMFLVNIPQVIASSQMKLLLLDRGASDGASNWLVALFAGGVAVSRVISGFALDRIEAHKVALVVLGLPALGLLLLATPLPGLWVLATCIVIIAVAQGAEGDIGAYMVSRHVAMRNYSLVMSLVQAALGLGTAAGAILLSLTLDLTGVYAPFLFVAAASTLVGTVLFYRTGQCRDPESGRLHGDPEPSIPHVSRGRDGIPDTL